MPMHSRALSLAVVLALSLGCGDDAPLKPEPVPTLPAPGDASGVTTSEARERWGEPCSQEVLSGGVQPGQDNAERWIYGATPCDSGWCPSACAADAARIDLFFSGQKLVRVSDVYAIPKAPPAVPSVELEMTNRSSVPRVCTMSARWSEPTGPKEFVMLGEVSLAPSERRAGTVSVPLNSGMDVTVSCHAAGVDPDLKTEVTQQVRTVRRSCFFHGAYFIGSDSVPAAEIGTDC